MEEIKNTKSIMWVLLAWMFVTMIAPAGQAQAAEEVAQRVVVVRVQDVIETYVRYKKLDRLLKKKFKHKLRDIEIRRDELEEEIKDLKKPENQEELDKMLAIQQKQFDLMQEANTFRKTVNALELKMVKSLFNDIQDEIKVQAKKKGAAHALSVVTLDQVMDKGVSDLNMLLETFMTTPVLYFDKDLDITDDVLKVLNERYDQKKDIFMITDDLTSLLTDEDYENQEEIARRRAGIFPEDENLDDEEEDGETPIGPEAPSDKDKKDDGLD